MSLRVRGMARELTFVCVLACVASVYAASCDLGYGSMGTGITYDTGNCQSLIADPPCSYDAYGKYPGNNPCTNSTYVPDGYYELTDAIPALFCGDSSNIWRSATNLYAYYQTTARSHTIKFKPIGRETASDGGWLQGKTGEFMTVEVTGTQGGGTVPCGMKIGVQVYMARACDSSYDGRQGLILFDQASTTTTGTHAGCGRWFVAAQGTVNMLLVMWRSNALQQFKVSQACLDGEDWMTDCEDTPDWNNGHNLGCGDYQDNEWCANGAERSGAADAFVGVNTVVGSSFNYPENNCCICGK